MAKGLDARVPGQLEKKVLKNCNLRLDIYSKMLDASAKNPTDARAKLAEVATGRALALCSSRQGFDPPPDWRYATSH